MGGSPSDDEGNGAKEYKGFKVGDIVTIPEKITRRRKREEFIDPQTRAYWVITDFDRDEEKIAVTRFTSTFEDIADVENSNPCCWCYRPSYCLRHTGHNVVSYQEKLDQAADKMRCQHDLELEEPTVQNLFISRDVELLGPAPAPGKKDWKLELTATSARYVENSDLDNLIAIAIQYFESKGYQADYTGYSQDSWQVCIFYQNGDLAGSLLFDALPSFDDPNQNSPWIGGYGDIFWRPDEDLEGVLTDSQITDLERLAQPLENQLPEDLEDFDTWLGGESDRDPFAGKSSEGLGLFATV